MSAGRANDLTIVVMTYNRYPRLQRLLKYARAVETPYRFVVLDSSRDPLPSGELQGLLADERIEHRQYDPEMHPITKLSEGLKDVSTPYVVQWADDDFLVPEAFDEGMAFLGQHEDYSIVHGQGALICANGESGADGMVCYPYRLRTITHETGAARLLEYFNPHTVANYSIHRTENLQRNMQLCDANRFDYSWGELAVGGFAAIQGKVKRMDRLYMVRESHGGGDSWNPLGNFPGKEMVALDWLTGERFPKTYAAFRDCLGGALAEQDGIPFSRAQEVIKEAFLSWLGRYLTSHVGRGEPRARGLTVRAREIARGIPGLRAMWQRARFLMPHRGDEMSLPALLRTSSWYHADFMPIYRALTEGANGEAGHAPRAEHAIELTHR